MNNDFLIVGQGVAGTILAFALIDRGYSVTIIDDSHGTASSMVGIAVINPVTGRRHAKSWNIDQLLPHAIDTYTRIGKLLRKEYLSSAPLYQILSDARVEEIWMLRAGDPEFQAYLDAEVIAFSHPGLRSLRCAKIRSALHLQISALLQDAARWFTEHGNLIQETFEPEVLRITSEGVLYREHQYDHIVFCEGHRVLRNALFSSLEIYPMKGEYLVCRIPELALTCHLKSAVSIIPLPEKDLYWCGATYDRYNEDPTPTEAGRIFLMKHLQEIVHIPLSIEYHGVGIRATTRDRRPYVGTHPEYDHIHLIAGLGTKGASIAPYCASILSDHLATGTRIPREVDILRHSL